MTNKQKFAMQLIHMTGVPEKNFDHLSKLTLKSQMWWLKLWFDCTTRKPPRLADRPIFVNWPDFIFYQNRIVEFWRDESKQIVKERELSIEEGFKEIHKWGSEAHKPSTGNYEIGTNQN